MSTAASSTSSSNSSNNNTTPCRHTPSRRVVRTLNGEQLSISIPDNFHQQHNHLTQHWQQQQQQQFQQQPGSVNSMMVSPALPSPNFSNFMLTLSPLMQLSSPQPTMSPRDDMSATGGVPSNMTPMVNTVDEIPFAFQAGNDSAQMTTPATSTQTAAQPSLAPLSLPTHALMPPPPPRVRPPREQEHEEEHCQHHHHGHHHQHPEEQHDHRQRQLEQHEQLQQERHQQRQRLLQGEEEERDPHNHHLPAQGSEAALGNGGGTLADKFHLMQMGVVDAGGLMEGKGSLLGPATPTMQGVVMEGFPRSLAMGMVSGAEAFGTSDAEEEEDEEEGGSGADEGMLSGHLGGRLKHIQHAHHRGSENADEEEEIYEAEEEIYEAEGGYISSSSSDGTKSTMEHLQHDHRDLHSSNQQPHHSTSPAATAFTRRLGQGPSVAVVAAAAAAASNRSRGSSSIHKKSGSSSSGSSNNASRPVRTAAAARRHNQIQEMRRSPPPGTMVGGGLHHPQARASGGGTTSMAAGPRKCNCRKSKCLKLYCECFAVGAYCQDDCGCLDCNNTLAFEHVRTQAMDNILSRNPHAFTEKIQFIEAGATGAVAAGAGRRVSLAGSLRGEGGETTVMGGMQGSAGGMLPTAKHVRGCNCKKSLCIKKYCECFFAGVFCGENCQCEGCQNTPEACAGVHTSKKRTSSTATRQKQLQQQQMQQMQQMQASPSPSGTPTLSPVHNVIQLTSL